MSQERASGADPVYVYKPSLMGAPWELCLRPDALEWQLGRQRGRIPYARISRVRLSFRPATMQTRRFVAEIWWPGGRRLLIASTSWQSLFEQRPQDRAYGAFIHELNQRIAAWNLKVPAAGFQRSLIDIEKEVTDIEHPGETR